MPSAECLLVMDVRMEHTEGLGGLAEVWVGGRLLTVCDGVSGPDRPRPPGVLDEAAFSYMAVERVVWDQAVRANPGRKKLLDPVRRWSYIGYGQVLAVAPVVIDFGLLQMTDPNWSTDESLARQFVRINIDRLEIGFANEPDYPE